MAAAHQFRSWLIVGASMAVLALASDYVQGDDAVSAIEHKRQTIYHSPQKPGYTSWVGAWTMPDGDLMVSFTQATGPAKDRPQAPISPDEPAQDRVEAQGIKWHRWHDPAAFSCINSWCASCLGVPQKTGTGSESSRCLSPFLEGQETGEFQCLA